MFVTLSIIVPFSIVTLFLLEATVSFDFDDEGSLLETMDAVDDEIPLLLFDLEEDELFDDILPLSNFEEDEEEL